MLGAGMMVVTGERGNPADESAAPAGPFDITIAGRTISLRHRPTGHVYEYSWFRNTPHLRPRPGRGEARGGDSRAPHMRGGATGRHSRIAAGAATGAAHKRFWCWVVSLVHCS